MVGHGLGVALTCAWRRKNSPAGGATVSAAPGSAVLCSQPETTPRGSRSTEMHQALRRPVADAARPAAILAIAENN